MTTSPAMALHHHAAPAALRAEHEVLHRALAEATDAGGETGAAAANLTRIAHRHFMTEEHYVLPPLALLPKLAQGVFPPGADEALRLVDDLVKEMPGMLLEHRRIDAATVQLIAAAAREDKPKALDLCRALQAHAREEEEVLYPAALLVGRYLRLALQRSPPGVHPSGDLR